MVFYLHLQHSHTELGALKATGMSPQGRCGFSRDWVMHCFTNASTFFPKHVQSAEALKNSGASLLQHEIKCCLFVSRTHSAVLPSTLTGSSRTEASLGCQSPAESAAVELQTGLDDARPSKPEPGLWTLTVVSMSDIFRNPSRVQGWPEHSGLPRQHADTLVWMLGYLMGSKNHQPGEAKWWQGQNIRARNCEEEDDNGFCWAVIWPERLHASCFTCL